MMDPFRLCIALGPLAAYGLLLGGLHLLRRPWLISGGKDLAALAAGLVGLFVIGPMELFLPEDAAENFGSYVWVLMLAFYALSVSFIILLSRPRIVVYNITHEELRRVLEELVPHLDPDSQWAGDNLLLPNLGVQCHLDSFPALRNVSLCASGDRQHFSGWRKLEASLQRSLARVPSPASPHGLALVGLSLLMIATCVIHSINNKAALAQGLQDLLRM